MNKIRTDLEVMTIQTGDSVSKTLEWLEREWRFEDTKRGRSLRLVGQRTRIAVPLALQDT